MGDSKQGQIFIFATFVVVFLLSVGITYIFITRRQLKGREYQLNFQKALYIADAGIEDAINVTLSNSSWRTGWTNKSFEGGDYTVTLAGSSLVNITSTSRVTGCSATRTVQMSVNITSLNNVTFQPSAADGKDSYVYSQSPGTNYGDPNTALLVGRVKSGMSTYYYRCLVEFTDLTSIPSAATVTNATLSLYQYDPGSGTAKTIDVHQITETWNESTVTWTNQPDINSTEEFSLSVGTSDGWKSWNITNLCQSWHSGTKSNYGVLFKMASESGGMFSGIDANCFYSSDYTTNTTLTPKLAITYSPATVTVSDVSWQ